MTRSHGRCPKGERLRMGFPHGHRKTTTLVAGLRMTGMVAPMVLDGPINGDWFEAYVTEVLVPELRPGDIVIMDNLSSHKRAAVKEKIAAAGATCTSFRPTARTSIRSKRRSPGSKPCCARLESAPSAASGTSSAGSSTSSSQMSAPITSNLVDMNQSDRKTL